MKTSIVLKSAIIGSLVLSAGIPAFAQDPGDGAAPVAAKAKEVTVIRNDPGVEAVYKAQESIPVSAGDADAQIKNIMKAKDWGKEGRNNKGDSYFFIAKAKREFTCDNPAADDMFMLNREVAATQCILKAKQQLIEFANMELSASEQYEFPGSDIKLQFNDEILALQQKLNDQKEELTQLLGDKKEAEEAARKGTTVIDRINAFLDAALKKFDKEYDPAKISADKKAKAEKVRAEYAAAKKEWERIQQQIKEMRAQQKSTTHSEVETLAQMPVLGATVVAQAESWDAATKRYQVCLLLVWSPGLQKSAMAILSEDPVEIVPPDGVRQTMSDWLAKQDFSVMTGPRQFLDEKGNRVFVGIAARSCGKNADDEEMADAASDKFAQQMLAFSLKADVLAWAKARHLSASISSGEKTTFKTVESLQRTLSQTLEKTQIRGKARVKSDTVTHPISKDKIFVSVVSVDLDSVKMAKAMESESYAAEMSVNRKQAELRGGTAGLRDAHAASKNDPADFERGRKAGRADAENPGKVPAVVPVKKPVEVAPVAPVAKPVGEKKASGGVYLGDRNVNTDF